MMCQFYAAHGISPMVRIPEPSATAACMALDGGAQGIVAPYVETVDQVRALVGAVKYRPLKGLRLAELLDGRRELDRGMIDYLHGFNRDNYLIIGIESVPAYENLEALIDQPGVDGVFVGPHDMTVSMGIPEQYEHPDFIALIHDVIDRSRTVGKGVGIHFNQRTAGDAVYLDLMRRGMNIVFYGADIVAMVQQMNHSLATLRAAMGDTYDRHAAPDADAANCLGI
jgi:4-hydroxy-2-oxoheptanedioate aldolase